MSICCTPLLALSDTSAAHNLISHGSLTRWGSCKIEKDRTEVWSKHKLQDSKCGFVPLHKHHVLYNSCIKSNTDNRSGRLKGKKWLCCGWDPCWINQYKSIQNSLDFYSPLSYHKAFLSLWEWSLLGRPRPHVQGTRGHWRVWRGWKWCKSHAMTFTVASSESN